MINNKKGAPGMEKKLFVVTDIHGHYTLLKSALDAAGFDPHCEDQLLICCGDYFDRGSENLEVLKFFERLQNKVLLRGNHEDLLLKLMETGHILPNHITNGTLQTVEAFFGKYAIDPMTATIDFSGKSRMADRVCEFIEETVDYFETEHYLFLHGWYPDGCESEAERKQASSEQWAKARWKKWIEHYTGTAPIPDKTIVCGHVPTQHAWKVDPNRSTDCPDTFYGNGIIALDAGTCDSGQINVLVLTERI